MSSTLRLQPDTLDAVSARLGSLRTHDLETILSGLRALTHALDSTWESAAVADFRRAYGYWLNGYTRRCAELAAVEQFLRAVAAGYRETEALLIGAVDQPEPGAGKVLARPVFQGPAPNPVDAQPNVRFKLPADIAAQAISESEAQRLFALLAADPAIAWGYPIDGCYARADIMAAAIRARTGHDPLRVWAYKDPPDDNGDGFIDRRREIDASIPHLYVDTDTPYGRVAWDYHVAPMVPVRGQDGVVRYMVLDPALSASPLTTDGWYAALHATGAVDADWTRTGETPWGVGGSGYWPADDPGIPDHAERTNAFYSFCAANQWVCAGVNPVTGQGYLPAQEPGGNLVPVPESLWWPWPPEKD